MQNRIKELCAVKAIDQKTLAIDVGVSQPAVSDWWNQKKQPKGKNLKKLACVLGVTEAEILGYTSTTSTDIAALSEDKKYIADTLPKLNEQQAKVIRDMLDQMEIR